MTLVELIVVIFVIGLLLAILIPPGPGPNRGRAREIVCRSNLKMWGLTLQIYMEDNDRAFPDVFNANGTLDVQSRKHWSIPLKDYMDDRPSLMTCPSAKMPNTGFQYGSFDKSYVISNSGDSEETGDIQTCSYGINEWVYNVPDNAASIEGRKAENYWHNTDVKGTHKIPIFLDAMWQGGAPSYDAGTESKSFKAPEENGQWLGEEYDMMHFAMDRHKGKNQINVGYMDGHSESIGIKELWDQQWHKGYDTNIRSTLDETFWPEWMEKY